MSIFQGIADRAADTHRVRYIALLIVLLIGFGLLVSNLKFSTQSAGGSSTAPYAHDIQAAQNLVSHQTTSAP